MKVKITKKTPIEGTIQISGSKNTALPLIACALLTKEEVILNNVPWISDIINMIKILTKMGIDIKYIDKTKTLIIKAFKLTKKIKYKEVSKFRASYYLMGSILSRKNKVIINYPGGCNLGTRPIDYHLMAFNILGYKHKIINKRKTKYIKINKQKKCIFKIDYHSYKIITFTKPSVGATINTILASVKGNNVVIINNYANEPEVLSVIDMLTQMGANIIIDKDYLKIYPTKNLYGTTYLVPFDRMEAGSYLILGSLIPKSKLTIQMIDNQYLESLINVLIKLGVKVVCKTNQIEVESPISLNSIDIKTGPYPAFPTDLQQILSILLLRSNNPSTIKDEIYPDRTSQLIVLKQAGYNITIDHDTYTINPIKEVLKIKEATVLDLRGGFALICLAIYQKELIINNFEIIKRGYEDIEEKLKLLKIDVEIL